MKIVAIGLIALTLIVSSATLVSPVNAASLPGGASSLNESHGDWSLTCNTRGQGDAATVQCSVTQNLLDQSSKRRVLTIALSPQQGGGVKGVVIMPFGVALDQGATFQLDAGAATAPSHYRTCVPAGCIVPVDWPDATVKAMRSASMLKIGAVMDNGKATPFSITMNGFASAIDRAVALIGMK